MLNILYVIKHCYEVCAHKPLFVGNAEPNILKYAVD